MLLKASNIVSKVNIRAPICLMYIGKPIKCRNALSII